MIEESCGAPYQGSVTITCSHCGKHFTASHTCRSADDAAESCPLCGDVVTPDMVCVDSGVAWGNHHHAHALCALENLAARVAHLERALGQSLSQIGQRRE